MVAAGSRADWAAVDWCRSLTSRASPYAHRSKSNGARPRRYRFVSLDIVVHRSAPGACPSSGHGGERE
jgi:hypothetical protein